MPRFTPERRREIARGLVLREHVSVAGAARFLGVSVATVYRYVPERRQPKRTRDERVADDIEAGLFYHAKYGMLPTAHSFNRTRAEDGRGFPDERVPGERLRTGWLRSNGDRRPQRFPDPSRVASDWDGFGRYRKALLVEINRREDAGEPYVPRFDYPSMWVLVAQHPVPPQILTGNPDAFLDHLTSDVAIDIWFAPGAPQDYEPLFSF
jgi:hypothetical protein